VQRLTVAESEEEARDAFCTLESMIDDAGGGPEEIAALLDGLPAALRAPTIRRLGRASQRALFQRVEGFARLRLVDLVPARCADHEEVRHLGRNTLPAFRIFEKRLCRPPGESRESPTQLAGYNFQAMKWVTGPGYFLAREDVERGEVIVDYTRLPDAGPEGWPAIRSNERGLSRFVYGFMIDRMRRVSQHVTIGSASRHGREMGSYFVMSRLDP
jgi:hypothetical protein